MNNYGKAIAEIKHRAAYPMKIVLTEETARLAVEALEKKAERDKMRCENCKHYVEDYLDTFVCNHFLTGNEDYFPMNPTDFCSRFEPKENENDN